MFSLFSKRNLALLAVLLLNTVNCSLIAWECCDTPRCNRLYVGVFGGGIYSDSSEALQMGSAFFEEADGGILAVDASGFTGGTSSGFGGGHIGYEWGKRPLCLCSGLFITPAAELEAFWYSHTKRGVLINTSDLDRVPEHDFLDTFPMDVGVYLANAVLSLDSCWRLSPYIGGGIGAARISIHGATSTQLAPPEFGINHFSAITNDSSWAFAGQVKAGLRYRICKSLHIFGEYRYLFLDFSKYVFGSTVDPEHVHTSPWNVKVHNIHYNAFAFGIRYSL